VQKYFLKYAELFEAIYAGKYAEFGEICGKYMQHMWNIFPHIFSICNFE